MNLSAGTILPLGYSADPSSTTWLPCNGQSVSKSTYPNLFNAIKYTYGGSGDNFNVPDLRGYFLRGTPTAGSTPGATQKYATALPVSGPLTTTTNGNHSHDVPHLPTDSSWYYIAGSHYASWNDGSVDSSTDGNHNHQVTGGGDAESRPVNVYVDFVIYTDPAS